MLEIDKQIAVDILVEIIQFQSDTGILFSCGEIILQIFEKTGNSPQTTMGKQINFSLVK